MNKMAKLKKERIDLESMLLAKPAIRHRYLHDLLVQLRIAGVEYGINLPYGRTQETEADIMGIDLMAKAGFDSQQSIQLWKNMAKASGGNQPPELLSTHPSHNTRIKNLGNEIKDLPRYNASAPNCQA